MKITYIHHSSFSVEFEKAVFLFDYFEGDLPDFPKEKELEVFASHKHSTTLTAPFSAWLRNIPPCILSSRRTSV